MTAEPAPSLDDRIVEGLSDEQREAVLSPSRHIRIVAAAGAGKTETITRRLVYLLATGAAPQSLVAFTFTDKAAAQMKDRIYRRAEQILGPGATASLGLMYVGTIHAYCLRLLQDHFRLGNVDVLDPNREYAFISRHARELGIAGEGRIARTARLLHTAAVWCDELLSLDAVREEAPGLADRLERYFALLKRHRLITFGQLVRRAYEALAQDPSPVSAISNLIVDEFQDINRAQEELIHLIAARSSCCVVGDPRQCIYQWRGSDPGCFDRFSQRLPNVQDYPVTVNRRSVDRVIDVANATARCFENRGLRDRMTGFRNEAGVAALVEFENEHLEARWIADQIRQAVDSGHCTYSQVGILVRSVSTSGPILLDALEVHGIPVLVGGKVGLFRRPEAKALGMIFCWLGGQYWKDSKYDKVQIAGDELLDGALDLWPGTHDPRALRAALDQATSRAYRSLNHLYQALLNALHFGRFDPAIDRDATIMANLGRFNQLLVDYEAAVRRGGTAQADLEGLAWFITGYALDAYEEPQAEDLRGRQAVQLYTVHQAKGLEWPVVFVPCMTDRRFPSRNTGKDPENDMPPSLYDQRRYAGSLEDERRLFYVAVTRARDTLCISRFCRVNISVGPSPFLAETGLRPAHPPAQLLGPLEDRPPDDEVVTLTAGEILEYRRCPHGYRMRNCWGYQSALTPEIGYGRSVHHILRVLAEETRRGADPAALVDGLVDQEFHLPFARESQRDIIAERAKRSLRKYAEAHRDELSHASEVESRLEFGLDRRVTVAGRADVLIGPNDALELRDYKTADDPRLLEEAELQVRIYALGLRRLGAKVVRASVADVIENRIREVSLGRAEMEAAGEIALSCAQGILAGRFGARVGEQCGKCDFGGICRYAR